MNNKVLLYSTGNNVQYPVINHNGKEYLERMCVFMCVYIYVHTGEGNGNPLQYSCLENPMGRGAWWAIIHGIAKSRTRMKQLSSMHTYNMCVFN